MTIAPVPPPVAPAAPATSGAPTGPAGGFAVLIAAMLLPTTAPAAAVPGAATLDGELPDEPPAVGPEDASDPEGATPTVPATALLGVVPVPVPDATPVTHGAAPAPGDQEASASPVPAAGGEAAPEVAPEGATPAPAPAPTPGPASAPPAAAPAAGPTPVVGLAPTPAPSTAPTAAPEARPGPVAAQLAPEVTRLVSRGDGVHRLTMKLQPEALGEVRVTLTVRNGEVHVRLAASDLAQSALLEGAPELRRVLELTGATEARVVVRDLAGTAPTAGPAGPPSTTLPAPGHGGGSADAHGPGQGHAGNPDQHARTRGGSTARDGLTDGGQSPRHDPAGRPLRGIDLTM